MGHTLTSKALVRREKYINNYKSKGEPRPREKFTDSRVQREKGSHLVMGKHEVIHEEDDIVLTP